MLWLCLRIPRLPLEVFTRTLPQASAAPWAVADGTGSRQTILACNTPARSAGIRPGMRTASAYALAGNLRLCERDASAEREALEALAGWALQFTSAVSLQPPDALLLEIGASLRLFGGLNALLRHIHACAAELGYRTTRGVAPTPLGSWVLARAGEGTPVTRPADLEAALQSLPLAPLGLDEETIETLHDLGLRRLNEVLRLPRDGIARRFGPDLLRHLDRLLGRRADPRPPFMPPDRFERRLPLPTETAEREALLFPAHRLLLELAGYLLGRQIGTQQLQWTFVHHRRPATRITLGLAVPSRDPQHMLALLRERLTRTALAHPVEELGLTVTATQPLQPHNLSLYGEPEAADEAGSRLLALLRARLDDDAVQGLQCRPDYRPERAWKHARPGTVGAMPPLALRPLWLLAAPLALDSRAGLPWLGSPLTLESGPERIESGWWDGEDVARDYYIARDAAYARLWIFRERRGARGWFLHGLFA